MGRKQEPPNKPESDPSSQRPEPDVSEDLALAASVRAIGVPFLLLSLDGTISFANPAAQDLFGTPGRRLEGRKVSTLLAPGWEEAIGGLAAKIREARTIGPIEIFCHDAAGVAIVVEITLSPVAGAAGRIESVAMVAQEMKLHRKGEEAMSESEGLLRAVVETAVDGIITIDERGTIRSLNAATERIFGYKADEIRGRNVSALMPAPYRSEHDRYLRNYLETGQAKIIGIGREVRGLRKDGTSFPMDLAVSETKVGNRRIFTGIVRDITERKNAQRELEERQERLRFAQRCANAGVWEWDIATKTHVWSDELSALYGFEQGGPAPEGEHWLTSLHPDDRDRVTREVQETIDRGGEIAIEFRIIHPDKGIRWLASLGRTLHDEDGRPVRMAGIAIDITDRKRAEERIRALNDELQHAIHEIEGFSHSVSHDLRSPLRAIDGFSHELADGYAGILDEQGKGYLRRIREAVELMTQRIEGLLTLSRLTRQEMRREEVDLSGIARDTARELRSLDRRRQVDFVIQDGARAEGDHRLLRVVLDNLLGNAWKYTSTRDRARIEFGWRKEAGATIYFVRDNGVGFEMEFADRLFEPFHRLHSQDEFEGDGIGLTTVRRIIHRHGGSVWAEGKPGAGASFHFTLR